MLSANNPFRDRTEKPAGRSDTCEKRDSKDIGWSRNPFLDPKARTGASTSINLPTVATRSSMNRERVSSERQARSSREAKPDKKSSAGSSRSTNQNTTASGSGPGKKENETEDRVLSLKEDKSTGKSKSSSGRRKHLDKIDLLDVSGFSTGGFHHDGPFDACNPSRNKNTKRAPVLAFAKDSTAMSLTGGAPNQPVYFGDHVNNAESFSDYAAAASPSKLRPSAGTRSTSFDPSVPVDPIHGNVSIGLGATTFLEGTPASYSAMMARTVSDTGSVDAAVERMRPRATSENVGSGQLARKKSVIQRIRGAYRERATDARTVGEGASPQQPLAQTFDNIANAKTANLSSTREESIDRGGEIRRADSSSPSVDSSGPSGLIRRVKSLRVGRK
ncbi:hypothetical protein PYCC9005_002880 [Savitreella phatthalungensis]